MANWLLLQGDFADETTMRLDAHGIPCALIGVTRPYGVMGITFPEENFVDAMTILGMDATKKYRTEETDRYGTYLIEFLEEGTALPLQTEFKEDLNDYATQVRVIQYNNMEHYRDMEPVLKEYTELLGLKIRISNPHSSEIPVAIGRDDTLFIWCWAIPKIRGRYDGGAATKIKSCFGIRLAGGQSDGITPTGVGVPMVDGDGNTVAEVIDNNIFVLFDLPHAPAAEPLRAILESYCQTMLGVDKADIAEKMTLKREEALAKEAEHSRDNYINACANRLGSEKERASKAIKEHNAEIADYQKRLVETYRKRDEDMARVMALEAIDGGENTKYGAEYDALAEVEKVKRVIVRDGMVQVYTDNIYINYDGKTYDIGEFRIDIGTNGELHAINLTRTISGKAHPHIDSNGWICLGNVSSGIAELIANYEFAVVAQIMIQFLCTFNAGPHYSVRGFPVVELPEEEKDKKEDKSEAV